MRIGYIVDRGENSPERFVLREASATRTINSRGDKIKTKLLSGTIYTEDVAFATKTMKQNPKIIIVREPFFIDDELREKVMRWIAWANKAKASEYDPFASAEMEE